MMEVSHDGAMSVIRASCESFNSLYPSVISG